MRWYERHVDAGLTRWSLGELSPREAARMLRHAHACTRCGPRYERWVQAHRVFETGNPDALLPVEQETLTAAGLEAALAAAAPEESRARWPTLVMLSGALAAVFLAVVLTPPATTPEWGTRGQSTPAPEAALRTFCAVPGQQLREVRAGMGCPAGATLAFAAGARQPLTHVAVRVVVDEKEEVAGPFALSTQPGGEIPLELTVPLPRTGRVVQVTAAFSAQPSATLAALRGDGTEGVVVLRQEVRVEEGP